MNLTPRLEKIASLIPKNSVLADIGTDHAYIPVFCVKNGICNRAFAMDVNQGPLNNAQQTVDLHNLCDKIELRLSDGLDALGCDEADVVVIAGMGGLLIKNILEKGTLADGTLLILQPMLAQKEIRQYLYSSDIGIENEYLAKEDEKMYNIIVARVGKKSDYDFDDIIIGKNVCKNSPELFEAYCTKEINTRTKILAGLKNARIPDDEAIANVSAELEAFVRRKTYEN